MPEDQKPFRLGILSAAGIAKKNVRGIQRNKAGVVVVAVASRSLEKAQEFIKDTGLESTAKALGSYEELLQMDLDAVYVPLPAGPRKQWLIKAAEAGKHVLSEKPVALSAQDMDEILQACAKANVQFMDGTMWVHNPRAGYIQEHLRDEKLMGKLATASSIFHFACPPEFMESDVRTYKELDGLGSVGDVGWYSIGNILFAFNYEPPQQVQATLGTIFNDRGVVMQGGAVLLWEDGRRAYFESGFKRNLSQYVQVGGELGTVSWDDLCIPKREDVCEFEIRGKGGFNIAGVEQTIETKKVFLDRPQETLMWEDFARCVRQVQSGGQPDQHWPKISSLTTKLCCAVVESAENNCKVIHFRP